MLSPFAVKSKRSPNYIIRRKCEHSSVSAIQVFQLNCRISGRTMHFKGHYWLSRIDGCSRSSHPKKEFPEVENGLSKYSKRSARPRNKTRAALGISTPLSNLA